MRPNATKRDDTKTPENSLLPQSLWYCCKTLKYLEKQPDGKEIDFKETPDGTPYTVLNGSPIIQLTKPQLQHQLKLQQSKSRKRKANPPASASDQPQKQPESSTKKANPHYVYYVEGIRPVPLKDLKDIQWNHNNSFGYLTQNKIKHTVVLLNLIAANHSRKMQKKHRTWYCVHGRYIDPVNPNKVDSIKIDHSNTHGYKEGRLDGELVTYQTAEWYASQSRAPTAAECVRQKIHKQYIQDVTTVLPVIKQFAHRLFKGGKASAKGKENQEEAKETMLKALS